MNIYFRVLFILLAFALARSSSASTNSADSIYELGQTWTNQDGKAVAMDSLRGKVRVVAMFFSTCRYACPRITADMKAIEANLSPRQKSRTEFSMFSFDADGDQPPQLKKFVKKMELDESRWSLFHGPEENVRELAAVLGISYRRELDGSFSHGNAITLLDTNGAIVFQQAGLGADPAGILDAINRLTRR